MTKTEYLDLLRYYFRRVDAKRLEEILADYEAHFEEGARRGLSEEDISRELGSPHDVYETYIHEGIVEETERAETVSGKASGSAAAKKLEAAADKIAEGADMAAATAQKTWNAVKGDLPEKAAGASSFLLRILVAAVYALGFLVLVTTALVLYLISGTFPAIGGLPPLPSLSPVTLAGVGGTGLFAGLALFFTGMEIKKFSHRSQANASAEKGA